MAFLEELSIRLDSSLAAIHLYDFDDQTGELSGIVPFDSAFDRMYREHYCRLNPFVQQGRELLRSDRAVLGSELIRMEELIRTEFYCDLLRPQHLHHSIGIVALKRNTVNHSLTLLRARSKGAYSAQEQQLLTLLGPHLYQALSIRRRLGTFEATLRGVEAALDRIAVGVVLLNTRGSVLAINRKAQEIFRQADGLALGLQGPSAFRSAETRRFRALLGSATRSTRDAMEPPGGAMRISRPSGRRPYWVRATPLLLKDARPGDDTMALLFVSDPEDEREAPTKALQRLLQLTPTEARLTGLLLRGMSLADAAEELNITKETARTHLKRTLSKTGTHRQAELVQLCLSNLVPLAAC
jgi:DNA-binding CsgD family transcriptional regulator